MNTHAILCCLVKSLNHVVYEHVLIERVTEEVKRMLTAVNVNRVFTQPLMLVLLCFIEVARTSLLNIVKYIVKSLNEFALISAVHTSHSEAAFLAAASDISLYNDMTDFSEVDTVLLNEKIKAYRL